MRDWLRKLDSTLFSPPHTFQTVFALVAIRLRLAEMWSAQDVGDRQTKPVPQEQDRT